MRLLRLLLITLVVCAPAALHAQREKLPPADLAYVEATWPNAKRTSTGMRTDVLRAGTGEMPAPGDKVSVLYVGKLLDGTVFDQTHDPEHPFEFRLGRGQVIEGWEEGIQLMSVGEKRLLIIPFELGYGTRGDPPKIPRRATLVFEVELLKVEKNDTAPKSDSAPSGKSKKKVKPSKSQPDTPVSSGTSK